MVAEVSRTDADGLGGPAAPDVEAEGETVGLADGLGVGVGVGVTDGEVVELVVGVGVVERAVPGAVVAGGRGVW